uniref:Kazal-like domain-containing protein n=1 Tax=Crocodylus porosus TaxID=8502 RepID=A0A7M4F3A6_CROPO
KQYVFTASSFLKVCHKETVVKSTVLDSCQAGFCFWVSLGLGSALAEVASCRTPRRRETKAVSRAGRVKPPARTEQSEAPLAPGRVLTLPRGLPGPDQWPCGGADGGPLGAGNRAAQASGGTAQRVSPPARRGENKAGKGRNPDVSRRGPPARGRGGGRADTYAAAGRRRGSRAAAGPSAGAGARAARGWRARRDGGCAAATRGAGRHPPGVEIIEGDFLRSPVCEHTINFPACPLVYRPLCGTDGNTYDNECLLCMTQTKTKQNIQILKDGPC